MPPALDRLLARPSALRLLRALVDSDAQSSCALCDNFHSRTRRRGCGRRHVSVAAAAPLREASDAATQEENPHPPLVRRLNVGKASTWDELRLQSDVRVPKPGSTLLVDQPKRRENFELWVVLLQFRQRIHGDDGVHDIWDGLRARKIDVPTDGTNADVLWGAFLSHPRLKVPTIEYAADLRRREGRAYGPLYATIVGQALRSNPENAFAWHKRLVTAGLVDPGALRRVAGAATHSRASLKAFRLIYLESKDRNVYDSLITALCQREQYDAAIRWHQFLIRNNDRPSKALETEHSPSPNSGGHDPIQVGHNTQPESHPAASLVLPTDDKDASTGRFSREMMNRLLGIAHAVAPKQINDVLCARLFATSAFPVEAVISGLRMFGVEALGPLALRELAARVDNPYVIVRKIEHLKQAGISIGQTVFSRAVYKFAQEGRADMLSDLLATDQHPDVLEDRAKQKELLSAYLAAEDWQQVHRTLAILTIFHADPQTESWNILLRSYSRLQELAKLNSILEDMRINRIQITEQSLNSLHHHTLRLRSRSKRPITKWVHSFDDLRLMTNIWRSVLESGGQLPPWRWREILRRFGMTGRLSELRSLMLWLAAWYSPATAAAMRSKYARTAALPPAGAEKPSSSASDFTSHPVFPIDASLLPTSHPNHPLRQIFRPVLQSAIVEWGFKTLALQPPAGTKSAKSSTPAPAHHWYFGLRSLQLLRERGVHVDPSTVRKAVQLRLWILYGPGRSNRLANRVARQRNPYTLEQFVGFVNEFWGGEERLLNVPEELLEGPVRGERRLELFVCLFGRKPWWDRRRGMKVDLGARLELVRRARLRREDRVGHEHKGDGDETLAEGVNV
ncbi:hypothetical protein H2201_007488 [Coniosporium apollinis]|uniref:Pentatricopeptide repeat domain-containing protein n=1 Tax=Coniosporium apollinis TaxID=61459 RepID=A0ABQ9NLH8_9PEZI|nr:hypothetical protein H2201_007488 [Coniosporium apollinis]